MWKQISAILVLVVMTLGAGCQGGLSPPAAVPPAIAPVEGASLDHLPVYTFPFEDGEETIRIGIDPAVYAGAKEADRRLHLYRDLSEEEWIPIYYQAFANAAIPDLNRNYAPKYRGSICAGESTCSVTIIPRQE
jgi:hypothetical protein